MSRHYPWDPSPANKSQEFNKETIWEEFPKELLEAVAARLPIADVFRFRSVCKKWNSLLTSHTFSQQRAQIPQQELWFYTSNGKSETVGAMYDPYFQKWHDSTIPALPYTLGFVPVASAGGLVCFFDSNSECFFMCNPFTRSYKKLPAMSIKATRRSVVGMTLNGKTTSEGYKIVVLRFDTKYEVYDSVNNSWTHPGGIPSPVKMPRSLNLRTKSVSIDDTLYFPCSNPDGIVSYNTETRVWTQFSIQLPPNLGDHTLAESGGRIMLIGVQKVRLRTSNSSACVCVWELQVTTLTWTKLNKMPNMWSLDFDKEHVSITCLGNKGLVFLAFLWKNIYQLVTYDIRSRKWLKVPEYLAPFVPERRWELNQEYRWIPYGTSFHPCLAASA